MRLSCDFALLQRPWQLVLMKCLSINLAIQCCMTKSCVVLSISRCITVQHFFSLQPQSYFTASGRKRLGLGDGPLLQEILSNLTQLNARSNIVVFQCLLKCLSFVKTKLLCIIAILRIYTFILDLSPFLFGCVQCLYFVLLIIIWLLFEFMLFLIKAL